MTREEWELKKLYSKHRAYQETIKPILAIASRVYAYKIPTFFLYADGKTETQWNFNEQEKETLRNVDQLLKIARDSIFGKEQA